MAMLRSVMCVVWHEWTVYIWPICLFCVVCMPETCTINVLAAVEIITYQRGRSVGVFVFLDALSLFLFFSLPNSCCFSRNTAAVAAVAVFPSTRYYNSLQHHKHRAKHRQTYEKPRRTIRIGSQRSRQSIFIITILFEIDGEG